MMRSLFLLLLAPAALLLPAAMSVGEKAPHMRAKSIDQLQQPLPAPYDGRADADAQVDAALARARVSGKPLLIDFGANWCADCRVLAGVLEQPELKSYVARNFELVQVDVGKFDRNLDLPRRFGGDHLGAIPAVFVIDAATDKLRNKSDILALGDARTMTPQQIANWLAKWTK
jgi:thiol-disulfide isomerase/thioredoxin